MLPSLNQIFRLLTKKTRTWHKHFHFQDALNQMNCLYRGTKHWKLFEYKYEKWIYKHWEEEDMIGG